MEPAQQLVRAWALGMPPEQLEEVLREVDGWLRDRSDDSCMPLRQMRAAMENYVRLRDANGELIREVEELRGKVGRERERVLEVERWVWTRVLFCSVTHSRACFCRENTTLKATLASARHAASNLHSTLHSTTSTLQHSLPLSHQPHSHLTFDPSPFHQRQNQNHPYLTTHTHTPLLAPPEPISTPTFAQAVSSAGGAGTGSGEMSSERVEVFGYTDHEYGFEVEGAASTTRRTRVRERDREEGRERGGRGEFDRNGNSRAIEERQQTPFEYPEALQHLPHTQPSAIVAPSYPVLPATQSSALVVPVYPITTQGQGQVGRQLHSDVINQPVNAYHWVYSVEVVDGQEIVTVLREEERRRSESGVLSSHISSSHRPLAPPPLPRTPTPDHHTRYTTQFSSTWGTAVPSHPRYHTVRPLVPGAPMQMPTRQMEREEESERRHAHPRDFGRRASDARGLHWRV
ncbi:hypothetical protein B0H34DRAFT_859715 [Crassisporium funariophilum]|nr:hypothetical protein B0H34DRAFT_859715 [Crassisporium funariophilum]